MVDMFFERVPISKWEVLLPQVVLYSYKRFCMARLADDPSALLISDPLDLSGGIPVSKEGLWPSQIDLVSTFGPEIFKPYIQEWWRPELAETVSALEELDVYLRELTVEFDESLVSENLEKQNCIAELLEEDFYLYFDTWIPDEFREYFFFPSMEEQDEESILPKLQKILFLLKEPEKRIHKKTRRVNGKRALTPLRNSLSKIRKTRRNKQKENEILQISTSSPNHGT
jgi:hypothetical protein